MASNHKLKGAAMSSETREKSATVRQPDRSSGQKNRFPMPDTKHAGLALQDLPKAKGLTAAERTKIRSRALSMLKGKK